MVSNGWGFSEEKRGEREQGSIREELLQVRRRGAPEIQKEIKKTADRGPLTLVSSGKRRKKGERDGTDAMHEHMRPGMEKWGREASEYVKTCSRREDRRESFKK